MPTTVNPSSADGSMPFLPFDLRESVYICGQMALSVPPVVTFVQGSREARQRCAHESICVSAEEQLLNVRCGPLIVISRGGFRVAELRRSGLPLWWPESLDFSAQELVHDYSDPSRATDAR